MTTTSEISRAPSRATKSSHVGMQRYDVEVVRKQQLTPHLVRVTVGSEGLRGFRDDGPDQRFKLMLPRPGQTEPVLPASHDWYATWRAMDPDVRPILRTYTVRQSRPTDGELDIDMVLHEPAGPACRWAAEVQPGAKVSIQGAWAEYEVPTDVRRQLVVADHTALPAVAAICEGLAPDAVADVIVELPGAADELPLDAPPGVALRWVHSETVPGAALRAAVTALPAEPGWQYAWVCADKETVAELRRHLVAERGLTPQQIMFMGYWRTNGAIDD